MTVNWAVATDVVSQNIDTGDKLPVKQPPYRAPMILPREDNRNGNGDAGEGDSATVYEPMG